MSVFCRHNRFTADCPICSQGTVLGSGRSTGGRSRPAAGAAPTRGRDRPVPPPYSGPYAAAGPYGEGEERYEVRLERVPGGLRLAEWAGGGIRRRAPVLAVRDLPALVAAAAERGQLGEREVERLRGALAAGPAGGEPGERHGASPGRAGELRDELRVEALEEGRLRIARWVLRPNAGWELQQTPVMLPAARFAEALASAARLGVLASGTARSA